MTWTISSSMVYSFRAYLINISSPADLLPSQTEQAFCYYQALHMLFYLSLTSSPSLCVAGSFLFYVLSIFLKIVLTFKIKFIYTLKDTNISCIVLTDGYLFAIHISIKKLLCVCSQSIHTPSPKADLCSEFFHHWFCVF